MSQEVRKLRIFVEFLQSCVGSCTSSARRDDPSTTAATVEPSTPRPSAPWWRDAVIYQVYVRSFADGNGDGTGDLAGVRSQLPYLRDLGVDAIWFTPWYPSPLADGGYDVADYRAIDPAFGTLERGRGADRRGAATLGIRTIIDVVPNHVSTEHPWFQAALAAGPGSPERERFWFRPGRGDGRRRSRRPAGRRSSAARPGPARRPDGTPASGTCTCSRPSSPTSTGTTPTSGPSTRTSCGSGSTAASPACASTRPRCWSRTRRCPRSRPTRRRASTRTRTATSCTTSTARGARSPTATRHARARRRGLAAGHRALRPLPAARTSCTPRSTSTSWRGPWDAASAARLDRSDARRARAGRRPGDLGPLQPRRHPAGHPLRPRRHLVRVRGASASGTPTDLELGTRRARAAALLIAGAARLALHLPGRRARACPRSRTSRAERIAGPDALPLRRRRPGPRRLPRAAALVGRRSRRSASARTAPTAPWLPQPADWAALTVEAQERRPALDAQPLPRRPAHPPRRARAAATAALLARRRRRGSSRSRAASASCASSTSAPARSPLPARRRASCSPATTLDGRCGCRRTPRPGSASDRTGARWHVPAAPSTAPIHVGTRKEGR